MKTTYGAHERLEYFFAFLRDRIQKGAKQKDIADYIDKSAPYINKLYMGKQKSCPENVQIEVAEFFGISYEEMLEEGKLIKSKLPNTRFVATRWRQNDRREVTLSEQLEQLMDRTRTLYSEVITEMKTLAHIIAEAEMKLEQFEDIKEELSYFKLFHNNIEEGLTFFNNKREFVYSSNRWNFLDGIDTESENRVESLLFHLKNKVDNIEEVGERLMESFTKQERDAMEVVLKNGSRFFFNTVPIFKDNEFLGMLLINRPVRLRSDEDN